MIRRIFAALLVSGVLVACGGPDGPPASPPITSSCDDHAGHDHHVDHVPEGYVALCDPRRPPNTVKESEPGWAPPSEWPAPPPMR